MTEQEYIGIQAREPGTQTSSSQLFAFFRVRNGTATRFFPGVGSTIHFANRDTDTCSLRSILPSFLTYGDSVRITYKAKTVFLGTVEKIIDRHGAGSERMQDITCAGPWGKLARMVFRQGWYNGADYSDFSKVILNQYQDGTAINLNTQLGYILDASKTVCGFTKGQVSVSTVKLPYDETRDITVADAIRRELRFFPKAIVRFDYSTSTPTLNIVRGENTAQDASYVATVKKSERTYEYTAHPITGVDIEIETTGEIEGVSYRNITHQTAGNVNANNIDCLHATLPIEGASASTVHASLDCKTEGIPASLNDVSWWKQKHPRLANVATSYITITGGTRSGSATAAQYPRISTASVGEIEEAGLHAREEKFTCRCKISTPDDEEEEILLTMNFVTTNARTKKYTWVASSSSSSGQSVPTGLAAAILADRCGNLKNESMVVRLGAATDFPVLGDRCDNLFLQSFDVDCADLTASLNFGQPEYLSIEDMAGLLTGFRNRSSSSSSVSRQSGKKEDEGKELEIGGIPPISSTEFAPGKKTKTTIAATGGGTGGSIKLDSSQVEEGKTLEVHKLTVKASEEGEDDKEYQIIAEEDVEIKPGGAPLDCVKTLNGETGDMQIVGGSSIRVNTEGKVITIGYEEGKDPDPTGDPCEHPGGGEGVALDGFMGGGIGGGGGGGGGAPLDGPSTHPGNPCNCE